MFGLRVMSNNIPLLRRGKKKKVELYLFHVDSVKRSGLCKVLRASFCNRECPSKERKNTSRVRRSAAAHTSAQVGMIQFPVTATPVTAALHLLFK